MELIGKQIAIETILGQPPELHYPSWYAAQIEKLPPAPPEYLAEQAGILVTDADTISRQAALDIFDDYNVAVENGQIEAYSRDRKRLCDLPPAQPEPKRGKWLYQMGMLKCDQCLRAIRRIDHDGLLNFCPNCGADMREVTI